MPVIKSGKSVVGIRDGNNYYNDAWTLAPEVKPDVFTTAGKKTVGFYTDVDSIVFQVKPGKRYDFIIRHPQLGDCLTRIDVKKSLDAAHFSKKYQKTNSGHYQFETPEVQELVHIIMALTPTGLADSNLVEHTTAYYNQVRTHFDAYRNEPVVTDVEKLLAQGSYAHLKMDACGFYFNGNRIHKDKTYEHLNWGNSNLVEPLLQNLQDFASKTGFRQFYQTHQPYYDSLLVLMEKQTPIRPQWEWLEKNFPNRYQHYRITFSPLTNGSHSTNKFETPEFKQTIMFICGPLESISLSAAETEGLMTRIVFTEIDHNYVNPVSDKYLPEISSAFINLDKWADKNVTRYYPNAYSIFNEYMTWAVFTLYAYDTYPPEVFAAVNTRTETQMEKWRGFSRFRSFNQKLLELYKAKPAQMPISDLYPLMLKWCSEVLD